MGNLQKISASQVRAILNEIGREDDSIKFDPTKHEIDYEKTKDNYSVLQGIDGSDALYKRYEDRMSQLKCMQRDDVKVLGQWVWTAPEDLPRSLVKPLFHEITQFFAEKHGIENIAYSYVHLDEHTPHLHIGIIPAVPIKNPKEGGPTEKVCAKEVFTREYLQTIHSDLQIYVSEKLGRDVNLLNGGSLGIDGIVNFKKAKELAKTVGKLEQTVASLDQTITEKKEEIKRLDGVIADRKEEADDLLYEIGRNEPIKKQLDKEIAEKKGILETLKEKIKDIANFMIGSPNLIVQFYRWATGWEAKEEDAREVVKRYTDETDIKIKEIDGLLVPDGAPEEPHQSRGMDWGAR